jgi:uncharacterized YigZ family protein
MNFVDKQYTKTLEIKQSKFISHLLPYDLYDEVLGKLKEQHPKARHFVVAYRYLNEFNQVVEHSSDDGEPRGTSGKPTLMVLQGANIINSAIITVRYFGGTKLGTGGLVRAYSDATNLVLESANLKEYKNLITKTISFEYTDIRKIEYECNLLKIEIVEKIFENKTFYKIKSDEDSIGVFLSRVDRLVYLP